MQYAFFSVPAVQDGDDESVAKLNAFLRGHRILNVRKELVSRDGISFWSCCVEYLEQGEAAGGTSSSRGSYSTREKVDYRTILDADTFARFIKLRECRRMVAEEFGVPNYVIWTDETQAELAKLSELTKSSMMSVKGFGKGTFEKYGEKILALWKGDNHEEKGQSLRSDHGNGESSSGVLEGSKGEEQQA